MKIRHYITFVYLLIWIVPKAQQHEFIPGTVAPTLHLSKWISGTPLAKFEPGMLYLVEFTHVYCLPCREAIPHLTELAQRYKGQLQVLSVYGYFASDKRSEAEYLDIINRLKQMMGNQMDYDIALDTRDAANNKRWNDKGGFPTAFLIDRQGLMQWKGAVDVTTLHQIIPQVIAGTCAADTFSKKYERFKAARLSINRQMLTETFPLLLKRIDSLMIEFPEHEQDFAVQKFTILLEEDVRLASRFLKERQVAWPEWKISPVYLEAGKDEGLDLNAGLENYDRHLKGLLDTPLMASLILGKAGLYAMHQQYDEARNLADSALLLQDAFGTTSAFAYEELVGWLQTIQFHRWRQRSAVAATHWLNRLMESNRLSLHGASFLLYRRKEGLTEQQLAALKAYIKQRQASENLR